MAYLTEHASRQHSALVNKKTTLNVANQHVPKVSEGVEYSNFDIARKLNNQKLHLINALAQFPVSALWLFNQYEKNNSSIDMEDEEESLASDLATCLAEIKKHFVLASQYNNENNQGLAAYHKQQLSLALQSFPYTFNDLNKLTDLIVSCCDLRGLCETNSKHSDALMRHLSCLKQKNRLNKTNYPALFSAIALHDASFIFLSNSEMYDQALAITIAEKLWQQARQELATANSRLVLFIANQYKSGFLDFDDLVQEGQTGLLKAVDKFDYQLGFQFSTYAGYWIRQAISRALSRGERLVRVPCGQVANINKVYRAKNELSALTGIEPSVKELAEYTKLSETEIFSILTFAQTAQSLENYDDDDDAFAPIDYLEQHIFAHALQTIADKELAQLLSKAIETLNPREAKIICEHFGVETGTEMTLQEIGSELNLTRERVRQIQVIALNKIKTSFGQQLMYFL
jgi:RNA polymerase primary sigma factor